MAEKERLHRQSWREKEKETERDRVKQLEKEKSSENEIVIERDRKVRKTTMLADNLPSFVLPCR